MTENGGLIFLQHTAGQKKEVKSIFNQKGGKKTFASKVCLQSIDRDLDQRL